MEYPQLKGSFPENLKHLKNSMDGLDWKVRSFCRLSSGLDSGKGWARELFSGLQRAF